LTSLLQALWQRRSLVSWKWC